MATIIAIDDDEIFRELLSELLKELGHRVFVCPSAEALDVGLLRVFNPAMLVVDVLLPGVSGDELCRRLAEVRSALGMKVLLTSHLPEPELAQRAAACGADGYVTKRKLMADPPEALRDLLADGGRVRERGSATAVQSAKAALGRAITVHLENRPARVEARVDCHIPVAAKDARGRSFEATIESLSIGGARITCAQELPLGERISVRFDLEGTGTVRGPAKVIWTRVVPDLGRVTIGLDFTELPHSERADIGRYVNRLLSEYLKTNG